MASVPADTPPWLQGLNAPQREAATTLDGAVLVLAGAGTGKTRALTARLAEILAHRRAWPSEILSVTFTNKAAAEMRHRLTAMIGPAAEGMPFVGTFHSIAARMLRRHAELAGLRSNFTILDTDDVLRLLKRIIIEAGIDEKRWPSRQLSSHIDRWKNRGQLPSEVPKGEAFAFADGRGAELYERYQRELRTLNACDFGDLLLHMIKIFEAHPDVLGEWQRRFKFVLVDDIDAGVRVVNSYAAEHLEIHTSDAPQVARRIRNAGAIFIGPWAPVSLGDYAAGSNHVLPTAGCARHSSGLSVQTFLRGVHVVEYDEAALKDIAGTVITLANSEDLPAHGEAVRLRFESLKETVVEVTPRPDKEPRVASFGGGKFPASVALVIAFDEAHLAPHRPQS